MSETVLVSGAQSSFTSFISPHYRQFRWIIWKQMDRWAAWNIYELPPDMDNMAPDGEDVPDYP
jgi:hypothetical protein